MGIQDLLTATADENQVDGKTKALMLDASTVRQVEKSSGVSPNEYRESEVNIVTIVPDDSGSIFEEHYDTDGVTLVSNAPLIMAGHNEIIAALCGVRPKGRILVSCQYLNGKVLYPYDYVEKVPQMTPANFTDGGGTPLFARGIPVLTGVAAKAKEFEDKGISVRTWTFFMSDGGNTGPHVQKNVADLIRSMNSESHMVLALGVNDGSTDFHAVYASMGIKPANVLVATNDPKAIRAKLRMASQSAVAFNSPGATGNSGTLGGFAG